MDASRVLSLLNSERHAHGLPSLRMNAKLTLSTEFHNLYVAHYTALSHQFRGEPDFRIRISLAGYAWSMAGENLTASQDWTLDSALRSSAGDVQRDGPFNGHRLNILSPSYPQTAPCAAEPTSFAYLPSTP